MSIRARVVVAVTFQQVNNAPHAKASAQRDYKDFQGFNSACKKFNKLPP